jgi:hypothetical protein
MSVQVIQFKLGVGKHAQTRFSMSEMQQLRDELLKFPFDIANIRQQEAVKKAGSIGLMALKNYVKTNVGIVSGNLSRAVAIKVKTYKNNRWGIPVSVAVIGYRRSGTGDSKKSDGKIRLGNDRAFHSHLVEFGTKRRFPGKSKSTNRVRVVIEGKKQTIVGRQKERVDQNKKAIMSSFSTRGKFTVSKGGGRTPGYPKSFIAAVDPRRGLGAMPALHPLERSFNQCKNFMGTALTLRMREAVQKATDDLAKRNGG